MTNHPERVPSTADLSVESARFIRQLFRQIDAATASPILGLIANETARMAHHRLVDLGVEEIRIGASIQPLDVLSNAELLALQRPIAHAAEVAGGLDIGADGDCEAWLAEMLAAIGRQLDLRQQDRAVVAAVESAMAAESHARERQKRPPADVSGIAPWPEVSGGGAPQ